MIFDCFLFYNERSIFIDRINYLRDSVDFFVIVESGHSFTGKKKKFMVRELITEHFNDIEHKFLILENVFYLTPSNLDKIKTLFPSAFVDKNEYEPLLNEKKGSSLIWLNDYFQRELLTVPLLGKATKCCTIVLSDIDEIPDRKFYSSIASGHNLIYCEMKQYIFNLGFVDREKWIGSVKFQYNITKSVSLNKIRFLLKRNENLSSDKISVKMFKSGWHFTSMGSSHDLLTKMYSWGHQELNTFINRKMLKYRIDRGMDPFGRKKFYDYELKSKLPIEFSEIKCEFKSVKPKARGWIFVFINSCAIFFDKVIRFLCLRLVKTKR